MFARLPHYVIFMLQQGEIVADRNTGVSKAALWMIKDHRNSRLPNGSSRPIAELSFWEKFVELQKKMILENNALTVSLTNSVVDAYVRPGTIQHHRHSAGLCRSLWCLTTWGRVYVGCVLRE